MDVVKAVETYVNRLVSEPSGMKVLILDTHTTPIVSLASTQSSLLAHEVYLTDRIDNRSRDRLPHLRCICFLRPSESSLAAVESELRAPKYGSYYLYFSNTLSKTAIERLAEADEFELVQEVQEHFADYAPLSPSLFSLNHMPSVERPLYGGSVSSWDPDALERSVQGIAAVLLSLKKKPIIRYDKTSSMAKKLGAELQHRMQSDTALFDFRLTQVQPVLLILDRRSDPVTPLLTPWTYEAMVHELLGIQNGRVDLRLVPDIRPELAEVTLTGATDAFFAQQRVATFGDLGDELKQHVQAYQQRSAVQAPGAISSIADMKRFVEEYPEIRRLGGNVSKHVAMVGELSRLVDRDRLLEVGEIEQGLAAGSGSDMRSVQALVTNSAISASQKLRLVMLYALRYQKTQASNIASLVGLLLANGVKSEDARLVYVVLNTCGADLRQEDIFSTESLLGKGRSVLKGIKGVENVYMQHNPKLSETTDSLLKGRLREANYPFLDNVGPNASIQRPQDVIVFVIGGTTYEEARAVSLLQQTTGTGTPAPGGGSSSNVRLLLGGTCVHNSSSFMEMLSTSATQFPASVYEPPAETAAGTAMPSLNLNLGGVNVSLGGPAGTGVYRTSGEAIGVQADGIRDGVRNLFGKVRQGVDRMGSGL